MFFFKNNPDDKYAGNLPVIGASENENDEPGSNPATLLFVAMHLEKA